MRLLPILTALALLLPAVAACGDSSPDSNDNAQCEEGFRPEGPACIPIFDDCPGPAEIPVLGGGCQPVGVTECASGFESDGEGGCEPILPSEPCPPGTMEMIGHTECQPVGVIDCGDGFVSDGEGGCDAILPDEPCPWGYMEILGETECQPIGDCGTGTWGVIEIDATTVFVDASADATGADGSQGAPFVTIQEAYDVVVPGGQIAVAAGEYEERLVIGKPIRLMGRCAELVTIRGGWLVDPRPPVTIGAGGSGTAIRGVTLTGDAEGLTITEATNVTVAEVQIAEAESYGLLAENADITAVAVVAFGNHSMGIALSGSEAEMSNIVVRDTQPRQSDGAFGTGIESYCHPSTGVCGSIHLNRGFVRANHHIGIFLSGTEAEISTVVVRDTMPQQSDSGSGLGIQAGCSPFSGTCGSLRLENTIVETNHGWGISLWSNDAVISNIVVRDTQPLQSDDTEGIGIYANCELGTGICSSLHLDNALVQANHTTGISLWGTEAEIHSVEIRGTKPMMSDGRFGVGIEAGCDFNTTICGRLLINHTLLLENHDVAIALIGPDAALSSVVVRSTISRLSDGMFGVGIYADCDPENGACGDLQLDRALMEANHTEGIVIRGIDTEISRVVLQNTLPQPSDGTSGYAISLDCDPDTNACGSLRLSDALLRANHELGIGLSGTEAEMSNIVVRDTQPRQSDGTGGLGIYGDCSQETNVCGSLHLEKALVQANHLAGIGLWGTDVEISSVIVRDTLTQQYDGKYGVGIYSDCDPETGACGRLQLDSARIHANCAGGIVLHGTDAYISTIVVQDTMSDSSDGSGGFGLSSSCNPIELICSNLQLEYALLEENQAVGIRMEGTEAMLNAVVVRDTLPQRSNSAYGTGLQATCSLEVDDCGGLQVFDSLIQGNEMIGVLVLGTPTELYGVAVLDTEYNETGSFAGEFGTGIYSAGDEYTGDYGTLDLTDCLVDSSFTAGVAVQGVSGYIQDSVVHSVLPRALDEAYGYGIQVEGIPWAPATEFHVRDSLIQDAHLAGILYYMAGGTVAGTQISGGQYTIVMNQGANPVIQDDNDLSGSIESDPEWSNMDPAPAPEPLLPIDVIDPIGQ
ncbi:DUF1565 domain-containing protein [Myxococcota bacterium]